MPIDYISTQFHQFQNQMVNIIPNALNRLKDLKRQKSNSEGKNFKRAIPRSDLFKQNSLGEGPGGLIGTRVEAMGVDLLLFLLGSGNHEVSAIPCVERELLQRIYQRKVPRWRLMTLRVVKQEGPRRSERGGRRRRHANGHHDSPRTKGTGRWPRGGLNR